ncbi:MAG: putative Ig domain-containing protein, partial [Prosthecobacter sp.]
TDNNVDNNNDGSQPGGMGTALLSPVVNLTLSAESVTDGDSDPNSNLTLDFGLFACPAITVSPILPAVGTVGSAYSQLISASGGTAPYTLALTSGTLPSGLTFNAATGTISGTPTTSNGAGTSLTFTATDARGCVGTRPMTLKICPVLTLSTLNSTLTIGTPYSSSAAAGAGTSPYVYAVTSGTLPAGLSLNTSTGAITGTPTTATAATFTITATDANSCPGSRSFTLTPACPTISITPVTLPNATVGTAYSQTLTASGGTAPYGTWTITSGTLPAGLTLNASTGVISGTPTTSTGPSVNVTVRVNDTYGCQGTQIVSLKVCPVITLNPTSLANGVVGLAFNQTVTASGGVAPYTYNVSSGTLPAGVTLNTSTGALTGTPTTAATSNFTLGATDANGCPASRAYTVVIAPSLTIGNLVWRDDNNNGLRDVGEPGLDGVTVQLFRTTDNYIGNGDDVQVGSNVTTAGGGLYSFSSLAAGKYFVRLPSVPAGFTMSSGVPDGFGTPAAFAENDQDNDNNAIHTLGIGTAVTSGLVNIAIGTESITDADTDANTNTTIDFGFAPMPQCPPYLVWPDWRTLTRTAPTAGTGWISQPLLVNAAYTSQTFSNVLSTGTNVTVSYTGNMFDAKTPNIHVPRFDTTYDNVNSQSNPNDVQCNPMFFGGLRFTNNTGDTSTSVTTGVGTATGHAQMQITFDKDVLIDDLGIGSIGTIGGAREWAFVRAYNAAGTGIAAVSITGQTVSCDAVVAGTGPQVIDNGAAGAYLGGLDEQNSQLYGNASFSWGNTPIRRIEIQFWRSSSGSAFNTAATTGQASAAIRKLCFRTAPTTDLGDWAHATNAAGAATTTTTSTANSNLRLGATVDVESTVTASNTATADDTTNTGSVDDEDGVTMPASITQNASITLPVSVFNNSGATAYLNAWIDFNNDGVFNDTLLSSGGERLEAARLIASGASATTQNSTFTVPLVSSPGTGRGVRVRLTNQPVTGPTGAIGTG